MGSGDVTTAALLSPRCRARAVIVAKSTQVVSGLAVARAVFRMLDRTLRVQFLCRDGERARAGQRLLALDGRAAAILAGERVALNFLQRMSGIATLTARFVARVGPGGPSILDTRKTAPGLRILDKYAVACGGGVNHRMGLYDQILIKDNHRALWSAARRGSLAQAVAEARRRYPGRVVEVEVESLDELRDVIREGPDWILLDNMPCAQIRRCVREAAGRCRLEASGGITLRNIRRVAATGVDAISLGCLTHSVSATDISLEVVLDEQTRAAGVEVDDAAS